VVALRLFPGTVRFNARPGDVPLALAAVVSALAGLIPCGDTARAQGSAARTSAEAWVCTAIPRRFWLPIGVLTERLSEQGYTVLEAIETRDDCYALRLRDRQSRESTVIFDPVSAKPLR
jgi:hypothetical protein